jgi:hypothetical protein
LNSPRFARTELTFACSISSILVCVGQSMPFWDKSNIVRTERSPIDFFPISVSSISFVPPLPAIHNSQTRALGHQLSDPRKQKTPVTDPRTCQHVTDSRVLGY